MRWMFGLLAALPLVAAASSDDGYNWKRVAVIDDVSISVVVIESDALMKAKRAKFTRVRADGLFRTRLMGFSVLYQRNGEYLCTVYLRIGHDSATLAHEERHCYGWVH